MDEEFAAQDSKNPDGTPQHVWCHEIIHARDRLYVAWRDAGLVILDVRDPAGPRIISRLDYVPPFNGGSLGAAHTAAPVIVNPNQYPRISALDRANMTVYTDHGHIADIGRTPMGDAISKSQFKARALQYFRQVQESGRELIVTDHGRPVIRVVPYRPEADQLVRMLRGSVLAYRDPTEPVGAADWEALK